MPEFEVEYKGKTKFKVGDLVTFTFRTEFTDTNSIMVVQRIRPGKKCKYYYTVHPWKGTGFISITDYNEYRYEVVDDEFIDKHAEYFL